ncbi:hypothetical protein RB594_001706 [Gaeumannomyces avenae]
MAGPHNIINADATDRRERPKSVLQSFIHRRNNSGGTGLASSIATEHQQSQERPRAFNNALPLPFSPASPVEMGIPGFQRPLGELHHNQQQQQQDQPPRSPQKSFVNISLKSLASKQSSPTKPKKTKSSNNLTTLLSRPKSSHNLNSLQEEGGKLLKDKENRTPEGTVANGPAQPPPIYAQFCSSGSGEQLSGPQGPRDVFINSAGDYVSTSSTSLGESIDAKPPLKQRPKSFQPYGKPSKTDLAQQAQAKLAQTGVVGGPRDPPPGAALRSQKSQTWNKKEKTTRGKVMNAFSGLASRTTRGPASGALSPEPTMDPKDIDTHLEAMLDRRNIPENQRYKMRNLNATIKMEFVRQDWAETQAKAEQQGQQQQRQSSERDTDAIQKPGAGSTKDKSSKTKSGRGMSFTLSKGNKASSSPTKKKTEGTLGRHFRSKSSESVVSDTRPSSGGSGSMGGGFFSKTKSQPTPADFVSYMRKVQKPEQVEVGKLHKLRLILRNETVAWIEDFIRQGGMAEVVGLLNRIMEVEWREEHEDALLHENLLCLKALCTTALAMQYLHTIQGTLFPALLGMIFDPEKKGPSEFTTRNIVTSILFSYIESAPWQERVSRAATVLSYLRDQEGKEEERPVSFVLDMRKERPYRTWCKEAVSVTKEVFWIFLHQLNVVSLPADKSTKGGQPLDGIVSSMSVAASAPASTKPSMISDMPPPSTTQDPQVAYMMRHFPQERPPVPAAPYVGGVEWDATNYLASHLELMNAILACTPGRMCRNELREQLKVSGWERCLGGSLRLCKEKFYGAVHDGLRTWVAAAHDDGWGVRDVRYGPPPPEQPRSPPKSRGLTPDARKKLEEPAPKLDMPKLDLGLPGAPGGGVPLLSPTSGITAVASATSDRPREDGKTHDFWLS